MIERIALSSGENFICRAMTLIALFLFCSQSGCDACQPSDRYQLRQMAHEVSHELCEPDSFYHQCFCERCTPGMAREMCYERIRMATRECMSDPDKILRSKSPVRQELLACINGFHFFFGMLVQSDSPLCQNLATWSRLPADVRRNFRDQPEQHTYPRHDIEE